RGTRIACFPSSAVSAIGAALQTRPPGGRPWPVPPGMRESGGPSLRIGPEGVLLYQWWVFIHIVGVLGFLLAHGESVAVLFARRRERDPDRIRTLLGLSGQSATAFYVSFLVLLGGRLAAATCGPWWSAGVGRVGRRRADENGRRDGEVTYKRIVIGTDGSETAAVAQRAATALAKEFDAELVVTHAVDPSGFDAGRAEEILKTAVGWSV